MSRRILNTFLPRAVALGALVLSASLAGAAGLAPQSSDTGGVMLIVKPLEVSAGAPAWRFQLSLNTHSVELADDLMRTATLVDAAGKAYAPVEWKGDGPGGHHRKGTLSFRPLAPHPAALELHVQRPGETAPRTFRWKLQ